MGFHLVEKKVIRMIRMNCFNYTQSIDKPKLQMLSNIYLKPKYICCYNKELQCNFRVYTVFLRILN